MSPVARHRFAWPALAVRFEMFKPMELHVVVRAQYAVSNALRSEQIKVPFATDGAARDSDSDCPTASHASAAVAVVVARNSCIKFEFRISTGTSIGCTGTVASVGFAKHVFRTTVESPTFATVFCEHIFSDAGTCCKNDLHASELVARVGIALTLDALQRPGDRDRHVAQRYDRE
jgi:hypothetical protein